MNEGIEVCSNILKVKTQKTDRGLHPTQKAVELMEILISLVTKEGQTVLDPFLWMWYNFSRCKKAKKRIYRF